MQEATSYPGTRLRYAHGAPVVAEEFALPAPTGAQVLVRVTHSAISAGSELNFLRHGPHGYGIPSNPEGRYYIGYMTAGEILALGPDAQGWRVGQRVLCGGNHGSLWMVDPTNGGWLLPIDERVPAAHACFAILGDVALHGVRRAQLQIDTSVAVFGMGMVGQLTLQLARAAGAYPRIAVDLDPARLETARRSGATHTLNPTEHDAVDAIRRWTGGAGAETVFHCTAVASLLPTLLKAAASRGRVVLTGSASGDAVLQLQDDLLRREVSLVGVYESGLDIAHAYWPWTRERNRRACLRMMGEGSLDIAALISHQLSWRAADSAYSRMLAGPSGWLGVVLYWK